MAASLPVDTLVTVVYPDHCVLTRVVAHEPQVDDRRYFRVASDGTPMDALFLDDEGSTWIRGHHVPSSPEASAAVTALALRGQIDIAEDTVPFGPLCNIIAGLGTPTKNILMGAPTGALGAALVNHVKASKGAPPVRIYRKP